MINQQKIKEEIEKIVCTNCNKQPIIDIIDKDNYKINACCIDFEDEIGSKIADLIQEQAENSLLDKLLNIK